jgi:hypothetical protein
MGVLERFKSGALHVLVATDVAARGLDIKTIKTVRGWLEGAVRGLGELRGCFEGIEQLRGAGWSAAVAVAARASRVAVVLASSALSQGAPWQAPATGPAVAASRRLPPATCQQPAEEPRLPSPQPTSPTPPTTHPPQPQVLNYDAARDIDTHIHRVGRTGRAGDKEGTAVTLLLPKEAR